MTSTVESMISSNNEAYRSRFRQDSVIFFALPYDIAKALRHAKEQKKGKTLIVEEGKCKKLAVGGRCV